MYDVLVHSLAERVLTLVRQQELVRPGDRVGAAVSGGIDSVALLRVLIELRQELGIVVTVVHFNHKLRGEESDADQEFVENIAREYGMEFYCASGDVAGLAAELHCGVEAAARELRYGFFRRLLGADDEFTSAEAASQEQLDRSAESAAPAKGIVERAGPAKSGPQGLKPESSSQLKGTAEAVPLQSHLQDPNSGRQTQILDKIATGHTLDDQAETVLMRLIRGTGMRGLGGIHPRIVVQDEDGESLGEIVRPLLEVRRSELEQYLASLKQPWREDSTNAESKFTRNRVRRLVLPLLEREFNPAVVENFSELAEIARDEEDYWENEISGWLGTVVQWSPPEWMRGLNGSGGLQSAISQSLVQIGPAAETEHPEARDFERLTEMEDSGAVFANASVSRPWLLTEPKAVQRRVLKAIGEQARIPLEFKHIEEILRFAGEDGPGGKELSLPLGWKVLREPETMIFLAPDLHRQERLPDYEYSLPVPGRVSVPELGVVIEALRITPDSQDAEYNPQQLLCAERVTGGLVARNWRPGDRYWPAHTKAPKKIKELLQERHVPQPGRRLWPVVVSGDQIVWMRGFPVPAGVRWKAGKEAVWIRETSSNEPDAI